MGKCDWCGAEGEVRSYEDAFGDTYYVCKDCFEQASKHICRKCKTESDILIKGYCESCIQGINFEQDKADEEERMGVGSDSIECAKGGVEMTDEMFESWLMLSKSYSPEDFARDRQLRFLWVMVKLRAVGIKDNKLIADKFGAIEKMLDRSFEKLKGTKCTLIIACTDEIKNWAESNEVIDKEEDVYILKGM